MDKEMIRYMLPEYPSHRYEKWIQIEGAADLNVDMMLFSAERVPLWPELKEEMDTSEYKPIKKIWQTRCTCTACGEEFVTRHIPEQGGVKGFAVYQGEDGMIYPLDPVDGNDPVADHEIDDFGYDANILELGELDSLNCPWCFADTTVMHRSKVKGGRTKQVLGCTVENIGGYTALICWLTAKHIYDDGTYDIETYPRDAYVIGERGGITRYRHTKGSSGGFTSETRLNGWVMSGTCKDSFIIPYHDWLSGMNHEKYRGIVYDRVPFLGGCTGEKTGIEEYIKAGGKYPITYLKIWQKHRNVENLVKAGWTHLIEENITRHAHYDPRSIYTEVEGVDFSKKKPHEMLRMSKADFKAFARNGIFWHEDVFGKWVEYHESGGRNSALEFDEYYKQFHASGVACLMAFRELDDQVDFQEIIKYLQKQGMDPDDLHYLMDAREMARELYPDRELTQAELWPRNLKAVHDNLVRLQALQQDEAKNQKLNEGFRRIVDLYGHLEWTDGDLCIRLPRQNSDLIMEGKILDHCVARYGNVHVKGEGVIFFVRKYRRPERSYFTLNISMTDGAPKEVQLHGYKNEWFLPNHKQGKIPKKVRDFVDRWKREVLMPWWISQINTGSKEKSA